MVKATDIIVDALHARGVAHKDMAEIMGMRPNTLSRKISENRMTANEFIRIADNLGFNVTLTDRSGGSELKVRKRGSGRRVKRVLDGVVYDTNMADAVCRTPAENGWHMELFRDKSGRYFAVHYSTWDGVDPFITVCPDNEVETLVRMFGDYEQPGTNKPQWFAVVKWAPEDAINAAREHGVTLTEEQAEAWWERNESWFRDMMIERGNEILFCTNFEGGE